MKKHITDVEIRKIFSDPNALKKAIKLWKEAEKRGEKLIRKIKEERKKQFS